MCIPQARTFEDLMNRPGGRPAPAIADDPDFVLLEARMRAARDYARRRVAAWTDWSRLVREEGWR